MWHVPFSRLLVDQSVSNKTSQDHSPSSLVCNRGYVTHVIDGMTLRNGDDPPGSESCPKKTWLKPQEKMRTKPMKKNMWQPSKPTKYGYIYIYMCVCVRTQSLSNTGILTNKNTAQPSKTSVSPCFNNRWGVDSQKWDRNVDGGFILVCQNGCAYLYIYI